MRCCLNSSRNYSGRQEKRGRGSNGISSTKAHSSVAVRKPSTSQVVLTRLFSTRTIGHLLLEAYRVILGGWHKLIASNKTESHNKNVSFLKFSFNPLITSRRKKS